MFKVIWLAKFRTDLPRQEVLTWWRGHHAELAKATPGMLRYVQSHWVQALDPETHMPGGTPFYDGHAEHWFADRESYDRAMASDEWKATLIDGPNGFERSLVGGMLEETVISWHPMDDGRIEG
jgi:uncharacterized protein (TIGR02118 family)